MDTFQNDVQNFVNEVCQDIVIELIVLCYQKKLNASDARKIADFTIGKLKKCKTLDDVRVAIGLLDDNFSLLAGVVKDNLDVFETEEKKITEQLGDLLTENSLEEASLLLSEAKKFKGINTNILESDNEEEISKLGNLNSYQSVLSQLEKNNGLKALELYSEMGLDEMNAVYFDVLGAIKSSNDFFPVVVNKQGFLIQPRSCNVNALCKRMSKDLSKSNNSDLYTMNINTDKDLLFRVYVEDSVRESEGSVFFSHYNGCGLNDTNPPIIESTLSILSFLKSYQLLNIKDKSNNSGKIFVIIYDEGVESGDLVALFFLSKGRALRDVNTFLEITLKTLKNQN